MNNVKFNGAKLAKFDRFGQFHTRLSTEVMDGGAVIVMKNIPAHFEGMVPSMYIGHKVHTVSVNGEDVCVVRWHDSDNGVESSHIAGFNMIGGMRGGNTAKIFPMTQQNIALFNAEKAAVKQYETIQEARDVAANIIENLGANDPAWVAIANFLQSQGI